MEPKRTKRPNLTCPGASRGILVRPHDPQPFTPLGEPSISKSIHDLQVGIRDYYYLMVRVNK